MCQLVSLYITEGDMT